MTATRQFVSDKTAASSTGVTRCWFLVASLPNRGDPEKIPIGRVPFTVGRLPANDLCLLSSSVSKAHADIIIAVDAVLVRDLGSTNGTFVNGRRISDPTPVGEGDLVQFADREFRVGRAVERSGERTAISNCLEDGWLISQMLEVINDDRFTMAFQPIVRASGMRMMGVEALVRCQVRGLESPLRLFEAAARLGTEERLSEMCRTKAVKLLAGQPASLALFLNTDPRETLGPELIDSLTRLRTQAAGRRLVLEIHEQAVPDLARMSDFRAALRDLEIGLAYDDFGAGQSRLLEITRVPPDYLKFDRSLLLDSALACERHRALLQSLLKHAADCMVATVAEGLETFEAVEICRTLGFTHFQGYCLGGPVAAEDLPAPASRWEG